MKVLYSSTQQPSVQDCGCVLTSSKVLVDWSTPMAAGGTAFGLTDSTGRNHLGDLTEINRPKSLNDVKDIQR